jgi:hypothetical protein
MLSGNGDILAENTVFSMCYAVSGCFVLTTGKEYESPRWVSLALNRSYGPGTVVAALDLATHQEEERTACVNDARA